MATDRPVMFRAGALGAEIAEPGPELPATLEAGFTAGAITRFADISEFQPNLNDAAYLAWSKAVVIRAMYGTFHDDQAWYGGARRAALWKGGARWVGVYQYLTAGEDAAAQARAFVALLGHLADGEVPVCDLEEGGGNQHGRWLAWRAEIMKAWPQLAQRDPRGQPQLYSGLYFAAGAGLAPGWVAAYGQAEPGGPHWAWQCTSSASMPGIAGPADMSITHLSIDELAALAHPLGGPKPGPSHGPATPPGKTWREWITGGDLSLADFAKAAGIEPMTFLRIQVDHYGAFSPELAAYGNAVLGGTMPATTKLPGGVKLWTLG